DGLLPSINFHKITDKRTNNKPSPALHMPPQMCETFRTQPELHIHSLVQILEVEKIVFGY
ncbi:MAG: hypothetical protein LBG65_05900, partial [Puniceicoccales bacterium]|nr:hypothetical protein [Puniceicoccales bacterium]